MILFKLISLKLWYYSWNRRSKCSAVWLILLLHPWNVCVYPNDCYLYYPDHTKWKFTTLRMEVWKFTNNHILKCHETSHKALKLKLKFNLRNLWCFALWRRRVFPLTEYIWLNYFLRNYSVWSNKKLIRQMQNCFVAHTYKCANNYCANP